MSGRGCPGCRKLRRRVAELEARLLELEARLRELEARLGRNASNSSLPPSQNPPQAPAPVTKDPTGRAPGGQPGHAGQACRRLPPERVQHVVRHVPKRCARCHTALPAEAQPGDPAPSWHQVLELAETPVVVTEHQGHARTCPDCGQVTQAPIPAEVRGHRLGPRLTGLVGYLTGRLHASKRAVQELVTTVFGVPLALGSVTQAERELSEALAPVHEAVGRAARDAPVCHVDETGWKQAGQRRWLWTAVTDRLAYFTIHKHRSEEALTAVLGEAPRGIVVSDRWSAYRRLPVAGRQLCWAHLKRDFQKCVDRGGSATRIGRIGLGLVEMLFDTWQRWQAGHLTRRAWQAEVAEQQVWLTELLESGARCRDRSVARFCQNLQDLEPALWTFTRVPGVEPTNNRAERALRSGVLWRKCSFGCHSAAGCTFVARLLTVLQTALLRGQQVFAYLGNALAAHRAGLQTLGLTG